MSSVSQHYYPIKRLRSESSDSYFASLQDPVYDWQFIFYILLFPLTLLSYFTQHAL
ncbi:hypothetical protein L873DRAFT_1801253 [Choiromyces venosus 120613-1]|uniref:Uncharacterized protein n=1 Tax=Choiromyces venosus 120613-1 TaxID=1336337 RepID=A0A3N4JXT0_9PEZI|nr:hypothetical protein L873DRAFT_1801253 [Choiromyces venosus 120613-1]